MRKQLVYLGMPYCYVSKSKEIGANKPDFSEKDKQIRQQRFEIGNKVAAKLFMAGFEVFSPISMSHPIAQYVPKEKDTHDLWLPFDFNMILRCDVMFVLCIDGWKRSEGLQTEITFCNQNNMPIVYIDEDLKILEV